MKPARSSSELAQDPEYVDLVRGLADALMAAAEASTEMHGSGNNIVEGAAPMSADTAAAVQVFVTRVYPFIPQI